MYFGELLSKILKNWQEMDIVSPSGGKMANYMNQEVKCPEKSAEVASNSSIPDGQENNKNSPSVHHYLSRRSRVAATCFLFAHTVVSQLVCTKANPLEGKGHPCQSGSFFEPTLKHCVPCKGCRNTLTNQECEMHCPETPVSSVSISTTQPSTTFLPGQCPYPTINNELIMFVLILLIISTILCILPFACCLGGHLKRIESKINLLQPRLTGMKKLCDYHYEALPQCDQKMPHFSGYYQQKSIHNSDKPSLSPTRENSCSLSLHEIMEELKISTASNDEDGNPQIVISGNTGSHDLKNQNETKAHVETEVKTTPLGSCLGSRTGQKKEAIVKSLTKNLQQIINGEVSPDRKENLSNEPLLQTNSIPSSFEGRPCGIHDNEKRGNPKESLIQGPISQRRFSNGPAFYGPEPSTISTSDEDESEEDDVTSRAVDMTAQEDHPPVSRSVPRVEVSAPGSEQLAVPQHPSSMFSFDENYDSGCSMESHVRNRDIQPRRASLITLSSVSASNIEAFRPIREHFNRWMQGKDWVWGSALGPDNVLEIFILDISLEEARRAVLEETHLEEGQFELRMLQRPPEIVPLSGKKTFLGIRCRAHDDEPESLGMTALCCFIQVKSTCEWYGITTGHGMKEGATVEQLVATETGETSWIQLGTVCLVLIELHPAPVDVALIKMNQDAIMIFEASSPHEVYKENMHFLLNKHVQKTGHVTGTTRGVVEGSFYKCINKDMTVPVVVQNALVINTSDQGFSSHGESGCLVTVHGLGVVGYVVAKIKYRSWPKPGRAAKHSQALVYSLSAALLSLRDHGYWKSMDDIIMF